MSVAQKLSRQFFQSFRVTPLGSINIEEGYTFLLLLSSLTLSHAVDRWVLSLNRDAVFSVVSARALVVKRYLPSICKATRWISPLPIKVNIFRMENV